MEHDPLFVPAMSCRSEEFQPTLAGGHPLRSLLPLKDEIEVERAGLRSRDSKGGHLIGSRGDDLSRVGDAVDLEPCRRDRRIEVEHSGVALGRRFAKQPDPFCEAPRPPVVAYERRKDVLSGGQRPGEPKPVRLIPLLGFSQSLAVEEQDRGVVDRAEFDCVP